ncbi:MAG TPA: 16S rRNA (cytosine(967)-C(5))-methyltransferase RsmB [Terriglobales bacterium]|nr:16S rRNA (cytosine(967)-C(5))-methyltransferase RsmB [Terriglobales bacterium]
MISPARDAALDILLRVEHHGAFASELIHSERLEKLTPQDRGLCMELVLGVLRWRSRLDEVLASVSSQKLSKLDPEVLEALRLAAYQIGFLDRIPPHAAVNDSVELAKRKKKRSAAPFVNAVLRKLVSKKADLGAQDAPVENARDLARKYAHPDWMVERWVRRYGFELAERICQHDQSVPTTSIHVSDDSAIGELSSAGITLGPGQLIKRSRRVVTGDVTKEQAFLTGRVAIQDEASQLVAMLVGRGERLLDCCAAPGGKAAILAQRNVASQVVATEIHAHRAAAMERRLKGNPNIRVMTADATQLSADMVFDRVLADVPCSGTGTLGRNPEIKWRMQSSDLDDLHARQMSILRSALKHVTRGGRAVYSTCSLEPEENERVVEQVLRENSEYQVQDMALELKQLRGEGELLDVHIQSLLDGPFLRVVPGAFGTDGFFAAMIARVS